jgi:hypothetical protein
LVDAQRIICVEPSPDVAIAVANSFGASISVLDRGAGTLSGSVAEGVAQLAERTVAIQALLKQGYQACLDFQNGAITRTSYSQRTAKLDDLLVTMVLGEVAGGGFGRKGAAIGGRATADVSALVSGLSGTSNALQETRRQLNDAQLIVAKKEQELASEKAKLANQKSDEEKKATEAKIKSLEAELNTEKAKLNVLINQLRITAEATTKTTAEITSVSGIGDISAKLDSGVASAINEMQARFLEKDVEHTFVSACLIEMGSSTASVTDSIPGDAQLKALIRKGYRKLEIAANPKLEIFYLSQYQRILTPTRLLKFCESNLQEYLDVARKNRHEIGLRKLELAAKQIEAVTKQSPVAGDSKHVHLVADISLLEKKKDQLARSRTELNSVTIAPESKTFEKKDRDEIVARRSALLTKTDAQMNKITAALRADNRTRVTDLESEYQRLVNSIDQYGTGAQRKLWELDLAKQQVKANDKHTELLELSEAAQKLSDEADALSKDIKQKK